MTAIAMTRDSVDDIAAAAVGSGTLEGYEQSRTCPGSIVARLLLLPDRTASRALAVPVRTVCM